MQSVFLFFLTFLFNQCVFMCTHHFIFCSVFNVCWFKYKFWSSCFAPCHVRCLPFLWPMRKLSQISWSVNLETLSQINSWMKGNCKLTLKLERLDCKEHKSSLGWSYPLVFIFMVSDKSFIILYEAKVKTTLSFVPCFFACKLF